MGYWALRVKGIKEPLMSRDLQLGRHPRRPEILGPSGLGNFRFKV